MAEHLNDAELSVYVMGLSEPALDQRLSAHVNVCTSCLERLQKAARLERELLSVASSTRRVTPDYPVYRRVRNLREWTIPVAVAAAFAALWLGVNRVRVSPRLHSGSLGLAPVVCPDGPEQDRCVAEAHLAGLIVAYPVAAGAPMLGGMEISANEWEAR